VDDWGIKTQGGISKIVFAQIFGEPRRIWGTIFFHMCVGASPPRPSYDNLVGIHLSHLTRTHTGK